MKLQTKILHVIGPHPATPIAVKYALEIVWGDRYWLEQVNQVLTRLEQDGRIESVGDRGYVQKKQAGRGTASDIPLTPQETNK